MMTTCASCLATVPEGAFCASCGQSLPGEADASYPSRDDTPEASALSIGNRDGRHDAAGGDMVWSDTRAPSAPRAAGIRQPSLADPRDRGHRGSPGRSRGRGRPPAHEVNSPIDGDGRCHPHVLGTITTSDVDPTLPVVFGRHESGHTKSGPRNNADRANDRTRGRLPRSQPDHCRVGTLDLWDVAGRPQAGWLFGRIVGGVRPRLGGEP